MSIEQVRDAYQGRALEYIALFGSIEAAAEQDRTRVASWASGVRGKVIDVGCGPGQWTAYLRQSGADAEGIDPVPAFVEEARRRHPAVPFRLGRAESLEVEDASLGGILAWYSLIHTDPELIGVAFAEFSRCVSPGGGLFVGFFEGPELEPFDHAVTTAYFWPTDALAQIIESAGFAVTETHTRTDPGARSQGAIIARRVVSQP